MGETEVVAELKQILGAMIFCSKQPLTVRDLRRCLQEVAEAEKGETAVFAEVTPGEVKTALDELGRELSQRKTGFLIREVAGGYRVQSDGACGKWVRHLLDAGRPNRLSPPALETLAIIAYRQPISRPEIEAVRGVNVDHVIKTLLELQLVRIAGRSELPGRPLLYGTTQRFLEHFGLRDLKELSEIEPMLLAQREEKACRSQEPVPQQSEFPAAHAEEGRGGEAPAEKEEAGEVEHEDEGEGDDTQA